MLVSLVELEQQIVVDQLNVYYRPTLCSRNDAIGNVAVLFAALGVFGTGTGWPDLLVATIMGVLGLSAARTVIAQARRELKSEAVPMALQPRAKDID